MPFLSVWSLLSKSTNLEPLLNLAVGAPMTSNCNEHHKLLVNWSLFCILKTCIGDLCKALWCHGKGSILHYLRQICLRMGLDSYSLFSSFPKKLILPIFATPMFSAHCCVFWAALRVGGTPHIIPKWRFLTKRNLQGYCWAFSLWLDAPLEWESVVPCLSGVFLSRCIKNAHPLCEHKPSIFLKYLHKKRNPLCLLIAT